MSECTEPHPAKELVKVPTGIPGFDEVADGGLPSGRISLVLGGPGTGKSVLALQTLANGARDAEEPGLFLAFEESCAEIRTNAASFAWDLAGLERDGKLVFVDAQFSPEMTRAGTFTLEGMLTTLEAKVREMGAKRVVFDSLDVLLEMLHDPELGRQELRRIRDWLREQGLTGILTSRIEAVEQEKPPITNPFILFLADFVLLLHYRVTDRVALRELRILKYRGSAFEQNEFPFTIGPEGIEVGSFGLRRLDYPVSNERVSSGIPRLDTMLNGGYFRGSSILITGAPGTAKTTLSGAFAQAACRRKERTLYIAFDESPNEIVRNIASVNIRLAPYMETGLLQMHALQGGARSAEEHLIRIKALIEGYEPRCIVVDPMSALAHGGGRLPGLAVAQRLLSLAKSRGITLLGTSLMEAVDPTIEAAKIRVSTIADTWIHLTYVASGGERNRALTIVKARGIGHSNQVREMVLSNEGVNLSDVYVAQGQVLMGALRTEREAQEKMEQARVRTETARKRRELEAAEAEAAARLQALECEAEIRRKETQRQLEVERASLQRELEARRIELERLEQEQQLRESITAERRGMVRTMRRADTDEESTRPGPGEE
ncbi:circadian clock protein KaiC [Thiohalomonas denitrificans]|uniref:Circadian clock protein KaiC n=1 Tax=Thiohalomonas denitrificans TaxID=415747 RepID=A0A1G5PTK6_9GAMM|nr:circadian clock protein KaiC [Thiohalomonas denitrificans]SCZ52531.1 circadian clock protein KaiC [Thiohalomonas denitrificans]